MLITLILAAAVIVAMYFVRPHVRLIVVAALVVPGVFVPGSLLSLAELAALATGLLGLRRSWNSRNALVSVFAGYAVWSTVALLWTSPSSLMSGLNVVVRLIIFTLLLAQTIALARDDINILKTMTFAMSFGVVAQSLMVMIFIVSPPAELAFLHSEFANVLIGNQAHALFHGQPNNVLDPLKAGGLFVNGNVAALFGFVSGLALLAVGVVWHERWLLVAAGVAAIGGLATGSKSPWVILPCAIVAVILMCWGTLSSVAKRRTLTVGGGIVGLAALAGVILNTAVMTQISRLVGAADVRGTQWDLIPIAFARSPFLGLGYDGWVAMARARLHENWPPHNIFIRAWADLGAAGLMFVVAIIVVYVLLGIRALRVTSMLPARFAIACSFVGILWVFVHGLADNTVVYGDSRMGVAVAIASAILICAPAVAEYARRARETAGGALSL